MRHFEVICPNCAGGRSCDCHFECTGRIQPRITRMEMLKKYYRLTCITCEAAFDDPECEYAFDWYNLDGDCLAAK